MTDLRKYHGIIPAFYACYDDENEISTERTRSLARHLVNKGVQGLYVGGSSGECIYLEKEERMANLEAVMAEVKGECTIIAHVGCNNTRESMQLAAHAESLGVDAIASIPPIYFHLPEYSIAQYWNDISSAAPNTDFVIYNIPQLAGVALTPSLFTEMRKNPRVIGVKNSSMPTQDIDTFVRIGGESCVVFNGPDEQFVAGRAIGAAGGIGGTYGAMPELFLKMDALVNEGRYKEAEPIQHEVNAIITELCACKGNMYAVIKAVLKINEGLDLGSVRKPLTGLQEGDMPKVEAAAGHIREAIARFR
jgi:N-acetylneuraminate lyase